MVKKMLPFAAVMALVFAGVASGCTPEARQDVGEAGANVGQATEKSVEGTAEAASKAGTAVKEGAENAGEAVAGAANTAKEGVKEGASQVGEAVGGVAKSAQKVGAAMDLTPSVKGALVADKTIDASTINVDTDATAKKVMIKGTVATEAAKAQATKVAQAKLKEENSDYTVVNQLTVKK